MNAASTARIAAWNAIADCELPVGTQVIVKGGLVTIRPRGGRPVHVPYGPEDTVNSLYAALKNTVQTSAQGSD